MSEGGANQPIEPTRRQLVIGAALFFFVGLAAAVYLHWPALTHELIYKSDVRQSPHWMAYHGTSFRPDDLLVHYGSFNESPLMNALYWVGTLFIDAVWMTKLVAVVGAGLGSALFFVLPAQMLGLRAGALTAVFFTFFPDSFEYFAGGFSKAWMIPLLLVAVWIVDGQRWRHLLWLMPFAAIAYPVSAVLIGATAGCGVLLLWRERDEARRGLRWLAGASVLGVLPLLLKYINPSERIGDSTPSAVIRTMPEMFKGGMSPYLPTPSLREALWELVDHPFLLGGAVIALLILGRGVGWRRSWTALLLASVICYLVADAVFMRLYIPNRYTRYSMGVLLALWQGHNLDLLLRRVPRPEWRLGLVVAVFAAGGLLFQGTLRQGKDTMDRSKRAELCGFLASEPERILVAGHPKYMDDIPVQARRSVLTNYKMFHSWFAGYHAEMDRRTRDTFRALYATSTEPIDHLAEEYGVTHLVVVKRHYSARRIRKHDIYLAPYHEFIEDVAGPGLRSGGFLLEDPPAGSVLYDDGKVQVVKLPLGGES